MNQTNKCNLRCYLDGGSLAMHPPHARRGCAQDAPAALLLLSLSPDTGELLLWQLRQTDVQLAVINRGEPRTQQRPQALCRAAAAHGAWPSEEISLLILVNL